MAKAEITFDDVLFVLDKMCSDLSAQKDTLRELDAEIGDGDLGITLELGCRSLKEGLAALQDSDIGTILARSGMNFTKAASSTFGILLGSFFMGAGRPVMKQKTIGLQDLVDIAESAEQALRNRGKAEVGDKTMLDALVPAVQVIKEANDADKDMGEALDAAVEAAEAGMKSTIPLKSKHGRAAWQGEKTIGVQDAGATATYLIIESCVRHLKSRFG